MLWKKSRCKDVMHRLVYSYTMIYAYCNSLWCNEQKSFQWLNDQRSLIMGRKRCTCACYNYKMYNMLHFLIQSKLNYPNFIFSTIRDLGRTRLVRSEACAKSCKIIRLSECLYSRSERNWWCRALRRGLDN